MLKKMADIFSVLSDVNRLKIYSLLIFYPDGLYVCEINHITGLPYYTVSKCLKELENVNLIMSKRYGQYILYMPDREEKEDKINRDEFIKLIIDFSNSINLFDHSKIKELISQRSGIQCLCDKKI